MEAVNPYELSIFFSVFVMLQLWNLFNARCLGTTKSALAAYCRTKGFVIIAVAIFGWADPDHAVRRRGVPHRRPRRMLLLIIAATSPVLWIGELARWLRRK